MNQLEGSIGVQTGLTISATPAEPPQELASRLREYLGVSLKDRDGGYEALNAWKAAVESKGVLVFQASGIEVQEMRDFSIAAQVLPVIVLNVKDTPSARIFTLIHELAHLALGATGVCNLSQSDSIEVHCNAVAGETLVPRSSFVAESEVVKNIQESEMPTWQDSTIASLANKYHVSRQVILRRLQTLSLISGTEYGAKRKLYEQQASAGAAKKQEGGPAPPVRAVSSAGSLFTRLVLAGYQREKLTGSDVSEYLSVKLKHLPRIEELVSS